MSVLTYAAGDLFVIRITKFLSSNPENKWANSYEFKALAIGSEGPLLVLAEAIVEFEAAIHFENTIFDRALISTWAPDSVPYDPSTFISSTLTATGGITLAGDVEALNVALAVTRQAQSGRFGHLFYRNALAESDVAAPAGKFTLVSRSTQQTKIDGALTSSGFGDYIGATPAADLGLSMINADGTQVRPVINLRAQGVSTVPTDHAWFNRRPAP